MCLCVYLVSAQKVPADVRVPRGEEAGKGEFAGCLLLPQRVPVVGVWVEVDLGCFLQFFPIKGFVLLQEIKHQSI